MEKLLDIQNLWVTYKSGNELIHAVNGVDIELEDGMTLGLLGETGAGKTTIAKCIMQLIQAPSGKIECGEIFFHGQDLLKARKDEIRSIRGSQISMIFQDPMSALNPVLTVGEQVAEVISIHDPSLSRKEVWGKTLSMFETVGIPAERVEDYPHQFSGGMKQRVVIAIALACNPKVLIADEPTTALDVTIQAQILDMMATLKRTYGTATILITHDLGVIAQMCEYVDIIYAGEVIESATVHDIFKDARHPYTRGLLGAIPKINVSYHRLQPIEGLMPDPTRLPNGCYFSDRCTHANERCKREHPEFCNVNGKHKVRCFMMEKVLRGDCK